MEKITAYKGMDKDMTCRGFQYEVGKEYEHDGNVETCSEGFHACEYPLDVLDYYSPAHSRFFAVEQSGKIDKGGDKTSSSEIKINAEIGIDGLAKAAIEYTFSRAENTDKNTESGDRSASQASGYQSASQSSGDQSASQASGSYSASQSSGDKSASQSSGDQSASQSSGDQSASQSSGDRSASQATGDYSASQVTGNYSASQATGDKSASQVTGDKSASQVTGNYSASQATGDKSASQVTGDYSESHADGKYSIATAWGYRSRAMVVSENSYMVLSDWRIDKECNRYLYGAHLVKVGDKLKRKTIFANTWYWFEDGKLKSEKVK